MINPFHPGRGRGSPRTLQEAGALVSQWQASGLSKRAWCNGQGILPSALNSCLHRTKRQVIAPPSAHPPFIEVQPRPPHPVAARVVRLSLAGSLATAELTIADLGALIEHLSAARL
jgi:hypothetical protein